METLIDLNFFSPRWRHEDSYSIKFSDDKMFISTGAKEAEGIQNEDGTIDWSGHNQNIGNPFLNILSNDSIYPPSPFLDGFISAWNSWKTSELSDEELESELNLLVDWVNVCSKNKPNSDYWTALF